MSIGGDAVRDYLGDGPGRPKKRLSGSTVSRLTQIDVNQVPVPIDRAVEIGPASFHFEIRLVTIPASSHSAPPMLAEGLTQHGGQLGFPLPHCFVSKDDASLKEHL